MIWMQKKFLSYKTQVPLANAMNYETESAGRGATVCVAGTLRAIDAGIFVLRFHEAEI